MLNDNGIQPEGIPLPKFDYLVYSVMCLKETSCNRIITATVPQNKSYKNYNLQIVKQVLCILCGFMNWWIVSSLIDLLYTTGEEQNSRACLLYLFILYTVHRTTLITKHLLHLRLWICCHGFLFC